MRAQSWGKNYLVAQQQQQLTAGCPISQTPHGATTQLTVWFVYTHFPAFLLFFIFYNLILTDFFFFFLWEQQAKQTRTKENKMESKSELVS